MKPILVSTAYFPPISYFAAIAKAEIVVVEAFENYQKQSYRNRCYIAGPNGKQMLNIPVIKTTGNHTLITDIQFSDQENWKNQHWNSILTAYNSSPFLLYYEDEIKDVFFQSHQNLWELNHALLLLMMELVQLQTPIIKSTEYQQSTANGIDLRDSIHPKKELQSSEQQKEYMQVFADRLPFMTDLSILDLLFNLGPEANVYIQSLR
jgi:hypothetical protein